LGLSFLTQAQQEGRKGSYFAFWGYNRSDYPTSDIHFTGPGYDFTLHDVVAADAPTPFDGFKTYFNPNLFQFQNLIYTQVISFKIICPSASVGII